MDRFAVISLPDDEQRVINSHPILKRLPKKYAKRCLKFVSTQISAVINDKDDLTELGYILDVPGFFIEWDKLSGAQRMKYLSSLTRLLGASGIKILCFPLVYEYLNEDEILYIENEGINILDGFRIRLCSMLSITKTILTIVKSDLPFYKVGVWGADTDVGRIWVELLSTEVNEMCIGGKNLRLLETMSSDILKKTGLACYITQNESECIKDKHIAVLADETIGQLSSRQPSFNIISYRGKLHKHHVMESRGGKFYIQSGWIELPQDVFVKHKLNPWDELGIIDGLLSISSNVYKNEILTGRITERQMEKIKALFGLYPLNIIGCISDNKTLHTNRIRMDYFRNRRKNLFDRNIIP